MRFPRDVCVTYVGHVDDALVAARAADMGETNSCEARTPHGVSIPPRVRSGHPLQNGQTDPCFQRYPRRSFLQAGSGLRQCESDVSRRTGPNRAASHDAVGSHPNVSGSSNVPVFSAHSTSPSAARSLTLPPGFINSALPRISLPVASDSDLIRICGGAVGPTSAGILHGWRTVRDSSGRG